MVVMGRSPSHQHHHQHAGVPFRRAATTRLNATQNDDGQKQPDPEDKCVEICSADDEPSVFVNENASSTTRNASVAIGIGTLVSVVVAALDSDVVAQHKDLALCAVFVIGYLGIILEENLAFNKSGVCLGMAVSLWVIRMLGDGDPSAVLGNLEVHVADVSQIIYFLLGAMTIVEIVDAHQGFRIVTKAIGKRSPRELLYVLSIITFFMSAVLDNLTSTIVMVSLVRKLVPDPNLRKFYGAAVVLAANTGGAWTPIGDVTTTMLWINGNISTFATIQGLVLPSMACLAVPVVLMANFSEEMNQPPPALDQPKQAKDDGASTTGSSAGEQIVPQGSTLVFATGVGALLFVPVFKSLTGLPPYLGMLAGLGVLWLLTDALHYGQEGRSDLRVPNALSRIDTEGILFFLGILLSVAALESAGLLKDLATFLDGTIPNQDIVGESSNRAKPRGHVERTRACVRACV